MNMESQVLEILEKNSKLTPAEIAVMIGAEEAAVSELIQQLEEKKIIFGYKALINWEKTEEEAVSALIELKVTPEQGEGFEKIAENIIRQYPMVKAVSLISGRYDLLVEIDGKNMKDVALFVAEKLAPLDGVVSTATHFILRRYKQDGVVISEKVKDERRVISL